nr:hypothetical protein [Tessaracoccus coleopterorum]
MVGDDQRRMGLRGDRERHTWREWLVDVHDIRAHGGVEGSPRLAGRRASRATEPLNLSPTAGPSSVTGTSASAGRCPGDQSRVVAAPVQPAGEAERVGGHTPGTSSE